MFNDLLEKKIEFAELFDVYSTLLTKKQQEVLKLYFFDDLSYSEIGELLNISKQAVFDTINKAAKRLKTYEENVGYLELKNKYEKVLSELENYAN